MKRILLALCLTLPCIAPAFAQRSPDGPGGSLVLGQVTGTGQLGPFVSYTSYPSSPSSHNFAVVVSGTKPVACTFQVEVSSDQVNWFALSDVPPQDCTTSSMIFLANKPVLYIRANVLTYTAATDLTSKVVITYTRGTN